MKWFVNDKNENSEIKFEINCDLKAFDLIKHLCTCTLWTAW